MFTKLEVQSHISMEALSLQVFEKVKLISFFLVE